MTRRAAALAMLAPCLAGAGCRGGDANAVPRAEVVVFAAASLQDALSDIAPRFQAETGISLVFNFGGSNVLAHQSVASRQADVFLSASEEWMDHAETAGVVVTGSRRPFLSNQLVVIGSLATPIRLRRPEDLATTPFRYLSLADPDAVPAGRYAKTYLESIGHDGATAWDRVKDRVVPAADVRAAMALVEARPDILGIVYRTDAAMSTNVRVLLEVIGDGSPEIRYSAAALHGPGDPAAAARFLAYLAGPEASRILTAHGFIVLDGSR